MRYIGRLIVAALVLAGAAGCGKRFHPAGGQVLFKDGTPLTGGMVCFEPLDPNGTMSAKGEIQPDGTFRLGTEGKGDGAPEGRYRVAVIPPLASPAEREGKKLPPPVIHPRYRNPETSGLEFAVTPDAGNNHFRIELERPRP